MRLLLKKFVAIKILVIFILFLTTNAKMQSEIVYSCSRYTSGHSWWNPFHWFSDYKDVDMLIEAGYVGNTLVIQTIIMCHGVANVPCPPCSGSLSLALKDNYLDQDFLDESAILMENHVRTSIQNGNYNGYQSFNTTYNNNIIYRNVSWESDTTTTDLQFHMNIIPVSTP